MIDVLLCSDSRLIGLGGGSCRPISSQNSFGPSAVVFSKTNKTKQNNNSNNNKINDNLS